MKEDMYSQNIYYTNLMLKLEKLEEKIGSLEREIKLRGRPIQMTPKFDIEKPITPEDFSEFLDFDKLKERSMV